MSLPVIAAILVVSLFSLGMFVVFSLSKAAKTRHQGVADRASIIKDANKRLSVNPRDSQALSALANIYFTEKTWDKALKTYGLLINLVATDKSIDEALATGRYGICALNLNDIPEAYKSLVLARTMTSDSHEVNYHLGYIEFRRGNVEKAVKLLSQAVVLDGNDVPSRRYLGRALYRQKKFKEAIDHLTIASAREPNDRETHFLLAQCYHETGQNERALSLYSHLRPDPSVGPASSLYAGIIHLGRHEAEQAIEDFELGLKHTAVAPDVKLELRYRLAAAYTKLQDLGKALEQLTEIQKVKPDYKDVARQIARSRELHSNAHLNAYISAPSGEFIALCQRVATGFFPKANVKIEDVQASGNSYVDVLTEIETAKWEDTVLFRFVRGVGGVGELMMRDLNSRLKETHAGRGFCITAGEFSEGAQQYVEARLIDLISKNKLVPLLQKIG